MVVRALGHGMRVCFIQFVKSADSETGEALFFENNTHVDFIRTGLGFIPPESSSNFKKHKKAAEQGVLLASEAAASGRYDLIVFDEICGALSKKLISPDKVASLIESTPEDVILCLTGRDAPDFLIDMADTVTDMRCVKHAFNKGCKAQDGVER